MVQKQRSFTERLMDKVLPEPNSGCWLWTGGTNGRGYGKITVGRRPDGSKFGAYAHRASWELHCGPIPKGMFILHRCDNPSCVNPEHLFLGTPADNVHDMLAKGRQAAMPLPRRGETNNKAKITEADVIAIRATRDNQDAVAAAYGVSQTVISNVRLRKSWTHVPQHPTDVRSAAE